MATDLNQTLERNPIVQEDIARKVLLALRERLLANFVSTVAAATLIFIVLWHHETNHIFLAWYLLTIFIVLVRLIENTIFKKSFNVNNISIWKNRFDIGALASGANWGIVASVIAPIFPTEILSLIMLFCGGLLSAAVIAYQASLRTYLAFALPIAIPVAVIYILSGTLINVAIGIMVLCFLFILSVYLVQSNKRFIDHIYLQAQNKNLISTLEIELAEHKESREALAVTKQENAQLVEDADDVIYKTDARANLIYVNKMTEQSTGYSHNELLRMKSLDFIRPDFKLKIKRLYLDNIKAGIYNFKHETPVVRKNGEILWGEMSVQCIIKNGKPKEYRIVVRDITKRKEDENKLRRAKEGAMSAKLLQEEFIASISHEIRTPMNAVTGFVDLLSKLDLSKEQRKYLDGLDLSSKRLLNVINDLLDMSKIQSGKLTFSYSNIKIIDAITSLIETFQPEAESKNLDLFIKLKGKIPEEIIFDPLRFDQIMQNLLSNAVKYTHKGKIQVIIKPISRDNNQIQLKISVKDTGIGIPEDKLENIFHDFHQVHEKPDEYHGTGLGLGIVKRLVEMKGGDVFAESKLNKGSDIGFTMWFEIPENIEEIVSTSEETTTSGNSHLRRKYIKSLKLLVADDNDMNLMIITKFMDEYTDNIIIDTVVNGAEALEKAKTESYDLIFMDLQMPEMNGYEATIEIRKLSGSIAKVPIMALTAALPPTVKLYGAGIDDFLLKPFTRDALYEKTDQILDL